MTIKPGQVYVDKNEKLNLLEYRGGVLIVQGTDRDLSVIDTTGDLDGMKVSLIKMIGEGSLFKSEEEFLKSHRLATKEEAEAAMRAWERGKRNRDQLIDLVRHYKQYNTDSGR